MKSNDNDKGRAHSSAPCASVANVTDDQTAPSMLSERQRIEEALISNDYSTLIAPDELVERFLDDDVFWDTELKDDRDIPLKEMLERDPTFIVVGKELELLTGKLAIIKAMKLEHRRQARFSDLSELLLVVAYLKAGNYGPIIEDQEQILIESGKMDWESAYQSILKTLAEVHGVSFNEVLEEINQQREKLNLTLRIPEDLIAEKLHEEMPNPVTFLLLGDMGAGKSFIQRRLEKWRQKLYSKLALRGYDRLLLRDRTDKNKAYLRTLPSGEGQALLRYFDKQEKTGHRLQKWLRRGVITLLAFPPVYQAVTLGLEMAKYQWGVLDDINPLVDVGVGINDNFHWVALYVVLFIYTQVEKWVRDAGLLERLSLRPQWIVDSLRSESVIIGDVEREKIVGRYEVDFKRSPQLGLVELPNWLQTDGKSLIIEQLSDLSHDAQSIFAQLVQEREFAIADRGEYTTPFLSFLSVGQNPHVIKDLIPPLKDRLKLGSGCVVVNAIDKNQQALGSHKDFISHTLSQNSGSTHYTAMTDTSAIARTHRIERKFMAFLKDFREKASSKPLARDALDYLVRVSSAFADDTNKIIINREFLGYLNALMTLSTFSGHDLITREDCAMAVLTTRTPDQKILMKKIPAQNGTARLVIEPGVVSILALSKRLELGDDPYLQEVAEENSVGYVTAIRAHISRTGGSGIHLLKAPFSQDRGEEIILQLRVLLESIGIDFSHLSLHIDLSEFLSDDDILFTGLYLAVRSALDNVIIHQDALIACQLSPNGDVVSLPHLNQRLITCMGQITSAYVWEHDRTSKIDPDFYSALSATGAVAPFKLNDVTNVEQLYREITHYESTPSEQRYSVPDAAKTST